MKKLTSVLLVLCLCTCAIMAFVGCDKCDHPEDRRKLKSTTATCTQVGVETYYCQKCGGNEQQVEVAAYGHDFYGQKDITGNNYRDFDKNNRYIKQNDKVINMKCFRCDAVQYEIKGLDKLPVRIDNDIRKEANGSSMGYSAMTIKKGSAYYEFNYGRLVIHFTLEPTGDCVLPDKIVDDGTNNFYFVAFKLTATNANGTAVPVQSSTAPLSEDGTGCQSVDVGQHTRKTFIDVKIEFTIDPENKSGDLGRQYKVDFTLMRNVTLLYKVNSELNSYSGEIISC